MKNRRGGPHRTKPGPAPSSSPRSWHLWLGGILLLTFAAYLPSLDNEFTNWDDTSYVTENPLVAHPNLKAVVTTPVASNYHPLTIASLALNYRLSGLNPSSYHWLNLLLHLANTALVFVFIRRLSRDRFWTSVATSLLFGIHPMHVESVAWIAERKDVLYAFFYLLGLIAYLRYLDRRKPVWLGATLVAALLSLASKPAAIVFPLALLAIDLYRRRRDTLRLILEKAPFLGLSLIDALLTVHAQRASGALDPHQWGPLPKLLFASYGVVMYVVKFFVPLRLSAIYPYPNVEGKALGAEFYLALGLVAVLLPTVLFLFRRNRAVLFGLAFFFIHFVLVLQVFTLGQAVMADRYTYLPYIGLTFALAWWLDERRAPRSAGAAWKPVVTGVLLLLVPVSLFQTWRRCDVWQSSETLWNDTIQKYPRRIVDAYLDRGQYYLQKRRLDAARADFDEAIKLNPRVARSWYNKGTALIELNQPDSALACFDQAVRLKPDFVTAWNNRGAMKVRTGDPVGAVADFTAAIALNPRYRDPYANRAIAYSMTREYEKSIADSRRAIELNPRTPDTSLQFGLIGEALNKLNRPEEAVAALDRAIQLAPPGEPRLGDYYLDRSRARLALGDPTGALRDAREAQRLGSAVDPAYLARIGG